MVIFHSYVCFPEGTVNDVEWRCNSSYRYSNDLLDLLPWPKRKTWPLSSGSSFHREYKDHQRPLISHMAGRKGQHDSPQILVWTFLTSLGFGFAAQETKIIHHFDSLDPRLHFLLGASPKRRSAFGLQNETTLLVTRSGDQHHSPAPPIL